MLDAAAEAHAERVVAGEVGALAHQEHAVRRARQQRLGTLARYRAVVPAATTTRA